MEENQPSRTNDDGPEKDPAFIAHLLDSLPDLVFAKDAAGTYLHVNRAFAEAMGRGPDSIIGRRDEELRPHSEADREHAADRACLLAGATRRDGDAVRAPLKSPSGRVIGVAGSLRPSHLRGSTGDPSADPGKATDRRTTTPNSADPTGGLESMLDVLPIAIYMKHADGTYAGANAAFARLLGADDPGAIVGRRDTDFGWRALDHPRLDDEVVHAGMARHGVQRREVDRFARRRWTETSVVPRTDDLGRVTGVIGIRVDITAHRDELRQVERNRAAAERASRSKSAFLTQMSHELRTPLTSLLGFAELAIEDGTPTPERLAHLARIRDNGWQVLALVDDLLDLSRIESGRLATRARTFVAREVFAGLNETYGPRLRAAGRELEVVVDDAVPEALTSDPIRFRQILGNLLQRALQEAPTGPVRLRASVSNGDHDASLIVEVCDEGPTIDPDDLARRLAPLEHEADDEDSGRGGLGLGLAIAWSLADLLEGRIDVSSGPDRTGTRFTLRIPIKQAIDETEEWSPATRAAHDPWQRVESAARDGVAWFAPPPEDLDLDADADADEDSAAASPPDETTVEDVAEATFAVADDDLATPGSPAHESSVPPPPPVTADAATPPSAAPVDIPSTDAAPAEPASSAAATPNPARGGTRTGETRRILLAEDTPDTARFLVLVLKSRGHTVEHASDGQHALELHEAATTRGEPFDIVLTDVQMPRMDGHTLTRQLRAAGWDGPIVALTAHASVEHRQDALDAGCDDHVAKPLTPEKLQGLVQKHTSDSHRRAA